MTGNRNGITKEAEIELKSFLKSNNVSEAHHGDCVGADKNFHDVCKSHGIKIIIHPPNNNYQRSFCKSDVIKCVKPYLVRNKDIVNDTDILIAFPSTKEEIIRSGTWSTIRYAKKENKKILIVFSDGETKKINYNTQKIKNK